MSSTSADQRGISAPLQDADSAPWWAAVAEHRLLLPHCDSCGLTWFPPTPGCPRCASTGIHLVESAGRGRVYSWVVVNRALSDAFTADAPYTILTIDLEEGGRIFGRLLGDSADRQVTADAPVRARFYEVSGQTLVGFSFE